jgi:hypothetical protein
MPKIGSNGPNALPFWVVSYPNPCFCCYHVFASTFSCHFRVPSSDSHCKAIPYSFGFYLVCHLVAALNPTDLDALDESVPFTKTNPFVRSIAARP